MDEVPLPTPPQSVAMPAVAATPTPVRSVTQISSLSAPLCPRCHFAVRPEYYFCPNCGAQLSAPPLSTSVLDQILFYAFSIILPWIAYLAITKWPGIKYLRSPNPRAKEVGIIMLILLVASSVVAFWLTTVWIQGYIQSAQSQLNNINLQNF